MCPFSKTKKKPAEEEPRVIINKLYEDILKEHPIDASRTDKQLWNDYVKYGEMFIDVDGTKPPTEDVFLTAVKKRIYNRLLGKRK